MRRLRIAHLTVQAVLVWDDGDDLAPGPTTDPMVVAVADLPAVAENLRAELPALEERLLDRG